MDNILKLANMKVDKYNSKSNYELVMNYAKDNNLILLEEISKPQVIYNFYSMTPYKHANNLCNLLFENDNKFVSMQTNIVNKFFTIKLAMNVFITIELLYAYNRNDIYDMLSIVNGYYIIDDISKIILDCKQLYDIDFIMSADNKIKSDEVNILINNFLSDKNISNQKNKIDKTNLKYNIIKKIFNELSKSKFEFLFLSYYAIILSEQQSQNDFDFNNPISIITSENVNRIMKYIKTINKDIISYVDNFYVIGNFRLILTVVYIIVKGKKITIMHIYNSTNYEIIPSIANNIPSKYVILYFLFVDLIKRKIYNFGMHDIIINISNANKLKNKIKSNSIKYIGTYRDEGYDKILEIKNNKYFIGIYQPLLYLHINNNLKIAN